MKKTVIILGLLAFSFTLLAQNVKENKREFVGSCLLNLDWNKSKTLVSKQSYDGNYGSGAFAKINDTQTAFLNEVTNRLDIFENRNRVNSFKTGISPSFGMNYIQDQYYIFGLYQCAIHNSDGSLSEIVNLPESLKVVEKVVEMNGKIYFLSSDQKSYFKNGDKFEIIEGLPLSKDLFSKVIKVNSHLLAIKYFTQKTTQTYYFSVKKEMASVKIIGGDSSELFLDVEYIKQEKPLIAERELLALSIKDTEITEIASLQLPNSYYLSIQQDIQYTNHSIYYYLTTPTEASIYKLNLSVENTLKAELFSEQLMELNYHYNLHTKEFPAKELSRKTVKLDSTVAPISRKTIIERAEAFETYEWIATSENIYNSVWCDNQDVISVPWVVVGTNRSMPYMWDGFSSIEKYNAGMAAGLAAGNRNTSTSIGSMNCAEGVDCSGYVSQAWNTEWKYDTREFAPIIIEYSSWQDLKPGDIANKSGHIRMLHSWNDNGTMLMLEATSRDNVWRVIYNTYTISDMQAIYAPYYLYSAFDEATSISDKAPLQNDVKVFPNPVKNTLFVSFEKEEIISNTFYSIFDVRGKCILKNTFSPSFEGIDVQNLEKGIYILKINTSNSTFSKKFIKE